MGPADPETEVRDGGRVFAGLLSQPGARWAELRLPTALSVCFPHRIHSEGQRGGQSPFMTPSCTDFKTKLNPLAASKELPSLLSKPQK